MGEEETTQGEGGDKPAQTAISEGETGSETCCEPSHQPKLGGTVDVVNPRSGLDSTANRVDPLRLLGNGVVPNTAAKAFSKLTGGLAEVIPKI